MTGDSRVFLLIPRFDAGGVTQALYLLPDGAGWRLPSVTVPAEGHTSDAAAIQLAARLSLGMDATALLWLSRDKDTQTEDWQHVVVLEAHGPVPVSGDGAWVPPKAWADVQFEAPEHGPPVRKWMAAAQSGEVPAQRAPWARRGWYAAATAWIDRTLEQAGLARTGPVEQWRTWSISCLLRVMTTGGEFFYKAVPDLFAREPRLTEALAARYPGEIPDVLTVDDERHAMLMRGFTGRTVQDAAELSIWQTALRRYAEIQQDSATQLGFWLGLGCSDRRLPVLRAQVDDLLADTEAMLPDSPKGLTHEEIGAIRDLIPSLKAACLALESLGIPHTLEHGDLHGNNISFRDDRYVFYDWTDGCITHPFFCLATFLETAPADWHEPLMAAYLEAWEAFLPSVSLDEALKLARPLGALHIAVSYWDIRNATEPALRWELGGALPYFLREVLKYRADLAPSS